MSSQSPVPIRLLRAVCAVIACAVAATAIGVMTGLAGRQLYVLGLWELASGWMISFIAVSTCHFLRARGRWLSVFTAVAAALCWAAAFHWADAWAFLREQIALVADRGLLLSDAAVLRDTDDPSQLVDFSLLGETGATGVQGAARLLLQRGLAVHRALGVSHVIDLPTWLHAISYGLQAAVVALLVGRSVASLGDQPVCSACGSWLRRQKVGYLAPDLVDHARDAWLLGDRVRPPLTEKPTRAEDAAFTEDACARGCTVKCGFSILNRRAVGLSTRRPGVVARLPPVSLSDQASSLRDSA